MSIDGHCATEESRADGENCAGELTGGKLGWEIERVDARKVSNRFFLF